MYSIYADNLCIYSGVYLEENRYKLTQAKVTLSDNSAGQLAIVVPKTNIGYDNIVPMDTTITIKKDGVIFWEGRVLSGTIDFKKNKKFICEGPLAYLNDTIQPPYDYSSKTVTDFITKLLQVHNSRVSNNRKILPGNVTVVDSAFVMTGVTTNYIQTYEALNNVVNQLGGHLSIRYQDGNRYLDYLADYPNDNSQTIEFGKNLLDLAQNFDESEYCTVVIPLGASAGEDPDTGMPTYVTVKSVNHGSEYIIATSALAEHGRIEKVVTFNEIEDPDILYALGEVYLEDTQFNDLTLEITALDLNLLNKNISEIKILDKIKIVSKPHGINKVFPVTKVSLDLLSPENNTYTLGGNINQNNSLSSQTQATNAELAEKMNQLKATNALEFYKFVNGHEFTVRQRTRLCNIRFATKSAGLINWQAEILAHVTADEGYKAKIIFYYYLNNALLQYFPSETLESGEHIFSLYFPLEIETLTSYEWRVEVEVEHGQIIIPIGNMRGVIWGDKLVSQVGWNGYIDVEDTINAINLDSISVEPFTATSTTNLIIPHVRTLVDTLTEINLDSISVDTFTANVYVNKTSIIVEGIKWSDLKYDYNWADVKDKHIW